MRWSLSVLCLGRPTARALRRAPARCLGFAARSEPALGRPACCELTRVHATGSRPLARECAEAEWLGRQNDMEYGRG